MDARLAANAGTPAEFPYDALPEVAVVGRSNVGKSTFINALVGRRALARTSGRPGKTRRIHFYRLDDAMYLVDLPGFGYAAVSRSEQSLWGPMVESYLRGSRAPLCGALLLIDVRRGARPEERQLLDWLRSEAIPVRLLMTKSDKLAAGKLAKLRRELAADLGLPEESVAAVSGRTGKGLAAVGGWIREWAKLEIKRPDGSPLLP